MWSYISYDELYHHGILGMKWGIRRFQNKDGSLTEAGRKRYGVEEGDHNYRGSNTALEKAGISRTEDGDFVIRKGSSAYRMADADSIDSKRKYVSLTYYDRFNYKALGQNGALWCKNPENIKEFQYKTIDDIKIANRDKVVDFVTNEFYDTKVKDVLESFEKTRDEYYKLVMDRSFGKLKMNRTNKKVLKNLKERYDQQRPVAMKYVDDVIQNPERSEKVFNHFKSQGYKAISDIEDITSGTGYLPVILLNPKKSIKYN